MRINVSNEPDQIKITDKLGVKQRIKEVSCGSNHTCFLTYKHEVYSCGANYVGQLGVGFISDKEFRPIVVRLRKNVDMMRQVSCGNNHTLFLTGNSDIYSAGLNDEGQLGLGHYDTISWPERVLIFT